MMFLQNIVTFSLDMLFPALCAGCGREGRYICGSCELFLSEALPLCMYCKGPSVQGETHAYCKIQEGLDGIVCMWDYEGVVRKTIEMIKKYRVRHIVSELAAKAGLLVVQDSLRFQQFLSFLLQPETMFVPVPMWKTKERFQGFNHSFLIANSFADIIGKKVVPCLEKTKDTVAQEEIAGIERLSNVEDSFRLKEEAPAKAVLVDDFLVSGATLKECCKVLKGAGTKEVWACTMARIA